MSKIVAPFVYWAQSNTEVTQPTDLSKELCKHRKFLSVKHQVSLRVDLRDVAEPEVSSIYNILRNNYRNSNDYVNTKVLVEEEEIDFSAVGIGSHGEQRLNSICSHFHTELSFVIITNMLLKVLLHPRVLLTDKQGLHLRADRQGGSDQADEERGRLVAKTPL